jgi:hypothetical protein
LAQAAITWLPFMNEVFGTARLSPSDGAAVVGAAVLFF